MGYSCSAKASFTLSALEAILDQPQSNGLPGGGFYERGREQPDGAITGMVWRPCRNLPGSVERAGGFRIEPDGKITRFPMIKKGVRELAEQNGAREYNAVHGSWRDRGKAFLQKLEEGKIDPVGSWTWYESIAREWQQEAKVTFMAHPSPNCHSLAYAVRGMLELK